MTTPRVNNSRRQIVVVDDFLSNPDEVRELALSQEYETKHSVGVRSTQFGWEEIYRPIFERLLGIEIEPGEFGEGNKCNACFQWCDAKTPVVIHSDQQQYAGALYLTPDAPLESGTSFYQHKITGARHPSGDREKMAITFAEGNIFDKTKWLEVDRVGNVYNRLVLWSGKSIHSGSAYFGVEIQNARLFQVFFFNAKRAT
jgi:hypothetical protein